MRLFWAVLTMCELGATWAARADWPKDCVVEADVALRAWQGTFALLAALNASTAAVAAMNQRPRRLVAGALAAAAFPPRPPWCGETPALRLARRLALAKLGVPSRVCVSGKFGHELARRWTSTKTPKEQSCRMFEPIFGGRCLSASAHIHGRRRRRAFQRPPSATLEHLAEHHVAKVLIRRVANGFGLQSCETALDCRVLLVSG